MVKNRNRILEEQMDTYDQVWKETFAVDTDSWTPNVGSVTQSYTVSGIQMDLFDQDKELRAKYPALKDAYDHYHNIRKLCISKEKEDHAN